MKLKLFMPDVSACEVTGCAYNVEKACHARAITVGDGIHPACDTYFESGTHVNGRSRQAGVGACKVSACRHNRDYECHARAIQVGFHERHADCLTFEST